jgi:hypothetical protein
VDFSCVQNINKQKRSFHTFSFWFACLFRPLTNKSVLSNVRVNCLCVQNTNKQRRSFEKRSFQTFSLWITRVQNTNKQKRPFQTFSRWTACVFRTLTTKSGPFKRSPCGQLVCSEHSQTKALASNVLRVDCLCVQNTNKQKRSFQTLSAWTACMFRILINKSARFRCSPRGLLVCSEH